MLACYRALAAELAVSMTRTRLHLLSLPWLAIAACTEPPRDELPLDTAPVTTDAGDTTGPSDTTDPSEVTSEGSTATVDDGGPKLDVAAPDAGGPLEIAEVFGHSADTLYRLDPETKEVTIVGPFVGCTASIIDIALDADSNMYGTSYGSLWSIDRATGQCTHISDGSYPTSLSFVPAGTVDPGQEALVGFDEDQYIRIDPRTGLITPLGVLSGGLRSSGDLVAVAGGGSYLTVLDDGECADVDCIVELDPSDGTVLEHFGPLPYDQVFGLAFWAGRAYGFARSGDLFEIDFMMGAVATTPIPIPGAPAGLEFFGAGSTTSAPPAAG